MGAAVARAAGLTGKGVTVGVVDSGCDASHPDLADHVAHNVKLVSAEYANVPPDSSNTIVVPIEMGPYQNTDLGSGHGTHVAGIIAADSTTGPDHLGVAPDAELVCYSIGEVLFTTAVVTAYDHMLDQPDLWGIDVVNNSWGNSFRQFDPRNPVAVVTKAVAEQGVDGRLRRRQQRRRQRRDEPQPVLAVALGALGGRGDRRPPARRLLLERPPVRQLQPVTIGAGGHTTFTGDRIGVFHPDVTAPGVAISSSCDTAGTVVGPCPPGENTTASGTSMASPHIAGAAAVLLPGPTRRSRPAQVRSALQATATPVVGTREAARPTARLLAGRLRLRRPRRGRAPGPLVHLHQGPRRPSRPLPTSGSCAATATTSPAPTCGPTTRRGCRSAAPTAAPTR